MYIVLVHVNVNQNSIEDFKIAISENALNSNLEEGIVKFDVVQQADDPTKFILIEMYKDEDAAKSHKTTPHYLKWRDRVADMMAEPRKAIYYNEVHVRKEAA